MAKLKKIFQSFKGLDLRTSDLLRSEDAATSLLNMNYRQTGAMTKRKGYKWATDDGTGGYGLTTFANTNLTTGVVTEEVISVDDNLQKLQPYSFTITYSGAANSNTYYKVFFNTTTSTYQFLLYDTAVLVLTHDMGIGSEGGFDTISDLTTAINAISDFACPAADGGTTTQSAYIPVTERTDINTTAQIVFEVFTQVATPSGATNPFALHYAERTSTAFENATFAQMNEVLYISTGFDPLMKYDGNRVYNAGLPQPVALTAEDNGAGTAFAAGEIHSYLAVYEYKDAKENSITGIETARLTDTMTGTKDRDVTITYCTDTEFNLDQCVVDGAQSTLNNILVDTGHPLQVGDYVYIDDAVSGEVVSRKITALPDATHITVDGANVTVGDNDIISTVRISLYRTEDHQSTPTAPTLYYLVKEFVNDATGSTNVFTDAVADTTITANAQWVERIKPHGIPPVARYMDEWRGQLILSGVPTSVSTVFYSDIDNPEYFPAADNSFILDRKITGLKALDNVLYIFKKHSIDGVTGDLAISSFQVDRLSREGVGCAAHNTIQEVEGSLFFLSDRGVYSINNEGLVHVGSAIDPKFAINNSFSFTQATAYVWQADKKYLIHMPTIASGVDVATTATSETYAYDYFRKSWLEWDSFNLMGGMTEKNGDIYKMSRDTDADLSGQLHKILQASHKYDYIDHSTSITWHYKSPWFTEGEASVWKKYLRCKLHSYDTTINDFESDSFTVGLKTEHDYNNARQWTSLTYDFSGGALGWGLGPWGEFPWGDIRLPQLKKKLASKKVRSLRVILENDVIYENVLISGLEFEIATPYKPEMKE
jgi:hypothetical protein